MPSSLLYAIFARNPLREGFLALQRVKRDKTTVILENNNVVLEYAAVRQYYTMGCYAFHLSVEFD